MKAPIFGLTALLFSSLATASDIAPADAVRAANATVLPSVDAMLDAGGAKRDETFAGFGGVHPEQTGKEQALFQDGMGALFEPAVGAVVGCRDQSDPACRAVQILDRGFPERPSVPEDILIGRDTVIENAGGKVPGVDNGTSGCKPVVIETKPVDRTETCRAGRPFEDRDCRRGVVEKGTTVSRLYSCGTSESVEKTLACRIRSTMESTSDFIERCFFGTDELKPKTTVREEKTVTATAAWPVTCLAPQATSETVTCDEVLVVEEVPSCKPGTSVTATVEDHGALAVDACPGGDRVTTEHACGNGSKVRFSVAGFPSVTLLPKRMGNLRNPSVRACRATLSYVSENCNNGSCIASWRINFLYNKFPLGTMEGKLVYPDENAPRIEETWVDNCRHLRGQK